MFEHELKRQQKLAKELVNEHLSGSMNRRSFLTRAGALGISVPVLTQALGARGAFAQSASPSPAASENVKLGSYSGKKLKVSIALAETEVTVFNDVVVNGFKQATGGDVEVVKIEATDVIRTLQAQKSSGNVALDLLVQDNNSLAQLVSGGLVEELPEATQIMPAATVPALKDVLQFNGKYYFLPARPNVQVTYYNSTQFNNIGVQPPKTWDDLKSVGDEIKKKQGIGKVSIQGVTGGAVGVTVTQFLWQAGGDPLKINNDAGNQAFTFMQNLKPDLTPQYPTATFDTTNTYLLNESVLLAQNWPFGINAIVDQGGKKDVLVYEGWAGPSGKNVLVLGGDVFGVVAGTQLRDMALDFTRYWMTQDIQEQLTAKNAWPAMRSDANGQVADWQKPYFDVVTKALAVSKPRPNVTYWSEVENALSNAFNDIVTNGQDVGKTIAKYQDAIDKAASGS